MQSFFSGANFMHYRSRFRIAAHAGIFSFAVFFLACAQNQDIVDLRGEWEYKRGFESEFLTDNSTGWEKIALPRDLAKEPGLADYTGSVTLRLVLPEQTGFLNAGLSTFAMGRNSDVTRYYVDGRQVAGHGSETPYRPGAFRTAVFTVPPLPGNRHVLHIVLFSTGNFPLYMFGPEMAVAPQETMASHLSKKEFITFGLLVVYFAVGCYHLLLFIFRPGDKYNLFFGLFCTLISVYWSFRTDFINDTFGDQVMLRFKIEYGVLALVTPAILIFFTQFFDRKYTRFSVFYAVASGLIVLAILLTQSFSMLANTIMRVWIVLALPAGLYALWYLGRAALRKNRDARWLVISFLVCVACAIHDMIRSFFRIATDQIAQFAFITFVLGIAFVLARRFMRIHNEVEELNRNLEEKVRTRTEELRNTLDVVENLKRQQDGDYFLTSLLLRPLGGNRARGTNVSVEFFEKQRKRFQFKHWESEIGGDLSIADNVFLRGAHYIVFLNGDAMGKSIQGAGGALVLGTVFKAMIARTHSTSLLKNRYPEQWLKEMFLELQSVFISFEGSMLASAVFGLIDEELGLVYYINAEHPLPILYRQSTASFLPGDRVMSKIGLSELHQGLQIQTLQMLPGDVFILGSDGRDDIMFGTDAEGQRIINRDEGLFLRLVQEAEAELEPLTGAIAAAGELTDDLSLVRICYREDCSSLDEKEKIINREYKKEFESARVAFSRGEYDEAVASLKRALTLDGDRRAPLKALVRVEMRAGQLDEAVRHAMDYISKFPADTGFLLVTSYILGKAGEIDAAIDLGERYRLRAPAGLNNLFHLARLYLRKQRKDLALKILKDIRELDPENPRLKKVLSRFNLREDAA